MGIINTLIEEAELQEEENSRYEQHKADRLYDYGWQGSSDSSDTRAGRTLRNELACRTENGYGTIEPVKNKDISIGSLHKLDRGDTLSRLSLIYKTDALLIKERNKATAHLHDDLVDLSVAIIPRGQLSEGRVFKDSLWIKACHPPPQRIHYIDNWLCVSDDTLFVRDLVSTRTSKVHGAIPLSSVSSVMPTRLVATTMISPWSVMTVDSTGLVLALSKPAIPLVDGSSIQSFEFVEKGLLIQSNSVADFLQCLRPRLPCALP
eukprot:TRINITY_DN1438_c0_g2_i1.p1 TRINITY_DN1438_c0_g2~~TRINITY_DN1438_c0_g2_i1.p1  ORF type:complete len:263 (+),score=24.14 TRINITY_DN1438_c0_g2_i1:41-829(+)